MKKMQGHCCWDALVMVKSNQMSDAKQNSGFLNVFEHFCLGKRGISLLAVSCSSSCEIYFWWWQGNGHYSVVPHCRHDETDDFARQCHRCNRILKNLEENFLRWCCCSRSFWACLSFKISFGRRWGFICRFLWKLAVNTVRFGNKYCVKGI